MEEGDLFGQKETDVCRFQKDAQKKENYWRNGIDMTMNRFLVKNAKISIIMWKLALNDCEHQWLEVNTINFKNQIWP